MAGGGFSTPGSTHASAAASHGDGIRAPLSGTVARTSSPQGSPSPVARPSSSWADLAVDRLLRADVDEHLADSAALNGRVCVGGLLQREVVQRQTRLIADRKRAVEDGRGDILEGPPAPGLGCVVDEHELPA